MPDIEQPDLNKKFFFSFFFRACVCNICVNFIH